MLTHPNRSRKELIKERVEAELRHEDIRQVNHLQEMITTRNNQIITAAEQISRLVIDRDRCVAALAEAKACLAAEQAAC